MGYCVQYSLKLRIRSYNIQGALAIINHLHTDEMLLKHARGKSYPPTDTVSESYWYSWVSNPLNPYRTLTEAFTNWSIVEENVKMGVERNSGDFVLSGDYDNKWGQQDFLLQQLSPVLEDVCIHVVGEDQRNYIWKISDHQFIHFEEVEYESDEETDESDVEEVEEEVEESEEDAEESDDEESDDEESDDEEEAEEEDDEEEAEEDDEEEAEEDDEEEAEEEDDEEEAEEEDDEEEVEESDDEEADDDDIEEEEVEDEVGDVVADDSDEEVEDEVDEEVEDEVGDVVVDVEVDVEDTDDNYPLHNIWNLNHHIDWIKTFF
jgi:hypothetical protein